MSMHERRKSAGMPGPQTREFDATEVEPPKPKGPSIEEEMLAAQLIANNIAVAQVYATLAVAYAGDEAMLGHYEGRSRDWLGYVLKPGAQPDE